MPPFDKMLSILGERSPNSSVPFIISKGLPCLPMKYTDGTLGPLSSKLLRKTSLKRLNFLKSSPVIIRGIWNYEK